ncbi:MAG: proline iminopeptidase-family hydrolase [Gaiellaceae bacterium]
MPEEREGWIDVDGFRTWYRAVGDLDGPRAPLLCLHGGPGSTSNYFARAERLAGERAVVRYDQLGCGRSERSEGARWTLDLFRAEVDAIRTELGLERVHLLGTSWGGMLALEHALARPGTLASLVLSSTLASAEQWTGEVRKLRDAMPPEVVAVYDEADASERWEGPDWEAADEAFAARHFFRGATQAPELERMRAGRSREAYREMWGPNEWMVTGDLAGWDVRDRLGELDVPTLVIRGEYDLCTAPVAQTLVDGIRGARLVVFDESSHAPVLEETERYLQVVGDFLRETEGS